MSATFQLQFFKGRDYVPAETGEYAEIEAAFIANRGRSRRMVRVDKGRPLRPILHRRVSTASSRYRDTVIKEYMAWAQRAGLKRVAAYPGFHIPYAPGVEVYYVNPADFIGPAPSPEVCDE